VEEVHWEDGWWYLCPVVFCKMEIRRHQQLWKLKELEPQLRTALQMNPRMRKFEDKLSIYLVSFFHQDQENSPR
jgi:hypothetical protein